MKFDKFGVVIVDIFVGGNDVYFEVYVFFGIFFCFIVFGFMIYGYIFLVEDDSVNLVYGLYIDKYYCYVFVVSFEMNWRFIFGFECFV